MTEHTHRGNSFPLTGEDTQVYLIGLPWNPIFITQQNQCQNPESFSGLTPVCFLVPDLSRMNCLVHWLLPHFIVQWNFSAAPNLFCHSAFCIYACYFSCTRKGSSDFQFISLRFQGYFGSFIMSFQTLFSYSVPICVICKYDDFKEMLSASLESNMTFKIPLVMDPPYLCPFASTGPSA